MTLSAIVLAAGQGTRMKSPLAKVLHGMCGWPMLDFVLEAAFVAGCDDAVVVVGHGHAEVESHLERRWGERVRPAHQAEQRGTGHAARCAMPALPAEASVALLLYGDTPLVRAADLAALVEARAAGDHALAMLTCRLQDAAGYGRVIRDPAGRIVAVREHRDATPAERAIDEINPGMYVARLDFLCRALAALAPDNDQGELYLTDVVAAAAQAGGVIGCTGDAATLAGINDRAQLARAERAMYRRIADELRRQGATIKSGARIDAGVVVEPDATIEHAVVLRGRTRVGAGARVDVGAVLEDVEVAPGARILPYSVCTGASIGEGAQAGPFSHLRPGSRLDTGARVGNFVETKNTHLARGAKANHLAYLGDGEIGEGANVGAGTIFCNYDGYQKHTTTIGAGAFIGSDSQLVAPVVVGAGAYVATGTTVTMDVPDNALAIARVRQSNKEGYAPRLKARLEAEAAKKKAR